jgi:epoxyqueuosine reductase
MKKEIMKEKRLYEELKEYCLAQGADLFGVADISKINSEFNLNKDFAKKFTSAVSLGVRLSRAVLSEIDKQPTKLYFYHYRSVNIFLDQLALKTSNFIETRDFLALPIPSSQVFDWNKQNGHVSHKKIGYLAGLGWVGRNNLLVNPKLGSRFRIVTILTDMKVPPNKPLKQNCGNCRLCLKICPAHAVKENPADFDHVKCYEKLKEFQRKRVAEQFVCGVCVKACLGT